MSKKVEKVRKATHKRLKVFRRFGKNSQECGEGGEQRKKYATFSTREKSPARGKNRQKNEKEISSVRRKNIYIIYIIYNILLLLYFFFFSPLLFGAMQLLQESSQQNESLLSRISQTVKLLRVDRTFASVRRFLVTFFLHCCIFLLHTRISFAYAQKFHTSSYVSAKLSRVLKSCKIQ